MAVDRFRGNRPHVPFEIGAEEQQFIALEFGDILAFVERPQVVHERSAANEFIVRAGDGRAREILARRRSRKGSTTRGLTADSPRPEDLSSPRSRKTGRRIYPEETTKN